MELGSCCLFLCLLGSFLLSVLAFFLWGLKGRFISRVFIVVLSCYSYSPVLPWQSLFWFPSLVHSLRPFLSSCLLFLLAVHPFCSWLLSIIWLFLCSAILDVPSVCSFPVCPFLLFFFATLAWCLFLLSALAVHFHFFFFAVLSCSSYLRRILPVLTCCPFLRALHAAFSCCSCSSFFLFLFAAHSFCSSFCS